VSFNLLPAFSFLLAAATALAGCTRPSLMACANRRAICGEGYYCKTMGDQSGCFPKEDAASTTPDGGNGGTDGEPRDIRTQPLPDAGVSSDLLNVSDRLDQASAPPDGPIDIAVERANDTGLVAPPDAPSRVCGNGVVENPETCDPVSECESRRNRCMADRDTVRTPTGSTSNCTFVCMESSRQCGVADGHCPSSCAPSQDADCKKGDGEVCANRAECSSGHCVDRVCCNSGCSDVCRSCSVAGRLGMCLPICDCPLQSPSNVVPNGGFDRGEFSWTASWESPSATPDATGCPMSGSARGKDFTSNCFPIATDTLYTFGYHVNRLIQGISDEEASCDLHWYTDGECRVSDGPNTQLKLDENSPGWKKKSATVRSSQTARFARIVCTASYGPPALFDMFFLSPSPGAF
jgi:hypothetical protein